MNLTKKQYILDIKSTINQINDGVEPKFCRCSYFPTKNLVQAAINGEIGEEFRVIKYLHDDIIEKLADMMLENKK